MKKTIIGLLIAGAVVAANAQDKSLLETLVKKGVLTQQEAAQIAKDTVTVSPGNKDTKSIKIYGGGTGWYAWNKNSIKTDTSNRVGNPGQLSTITLRYVKLGIDADIGGGWTTSLVTDFGTEGDARNYLDKAIISKTIEVDYLTGRLDLGMRKVNMGYEQGMDDFQQLTIERSVATWFFTRDSLANYDTGGRTHKYFGSRTVGAFWEGSVVQLEGLYYSAAVTSSVAEGNFTQNTGDGLSFWASAGYKTSFDVNGEDAVLDAGMNFGYAPRGAVYMDTNIGSVWGINPYAAFTWRGATVIAEFFLQQVEDYSSRNNRDGVGHTPMGGNITVAYKFDIGEWGALEPVLRGSYVASNGMGVEAVPTTSSSFSGYYNNAGTFYAGVNWYVSNAVKTSIGYEYGYFTDRAGGGALNPTRMYSNTVVAQIQVLF